MRNYSLEALVEKTLEEDLGGAGDVTTQALNLRQQWGHANIAAREAGTLSGQECTTLCFQKLDPSIQIHWSVKDGEYFKKDTILAHLEGPLASLLQAERSALNFLTHLCGIATQTARFKRAMGREDVRLCCTRKTLPGLRVLEKKAVVDGGGSPHRFALYDALMIKDNHIQAAGSLKQAIQTVRKNASHMLTLEVEVDTVEQCQEAFLEKVDIIMLDNMSCEDMVHCVDIVKKQTLLEASGGVTEKNIHAIAQTGVDIISCGALTHSAPALDIALDFL